MSTSAFFGEQSPFEAIVAVVALSTGAYTLYKSFLERPKLTLLPGDRVGFVISADGGVSKFQLHCNVVNAGVKLGTLHRLEATVHGPGDWNHAFAWNLFFKYTPGGEALQPESAPHPVAVPGKASHLLFTEFTIVPDTRVSQWPMGEYEFSIKGWVNLSNRAQQPNVSHTFHVRLAQDVATRLNTERPGQPTVAYAPITEWSSS